MALPELVAVLLLGVFGNIYAQDFYVVAPNTLRLNSEEIIAVAVDGGNSATVKIFVTDHPGKRKIIFETSHLVHPDQPSLIKIHLDPANFPINFLNSAVSSKFVSLNVTSDSFQKVLTIPLTTQSGYVFIQTDKPIYTPKDKVRMRIIPLNEESLPSNKSFKLQIKNPDGNIVEEKVFNQDSHRKAFVSHTYNFPIHSVLGEWSAVVSYGHNFQLNYAASFRVEEYVLPTFMVELETPDIIIPSTENIEIKVNAKYVYGKKVDGFVTFQLGVKKVGSDVIFFGVIGPKKLEDGSYSLKIKTTDIKNRTDINWFPDIDGSHFFVEATVMDIATHNTATATNSKSVFSQSPFVISFKNSLRDFKPGLVSILEANINYVHGKPAKGISARIKAVADDQSSLNIEEDTAISGEDGKIAFQFQTEMHHSTVTLTIETDDPKYAGIQATSTFIQQKFFSKRGAYLSLLRSRPQKLQPGDTFSKVLHFEPKGIRYFHYLVVSKGRIIIMKKLPEGEFKTQNLEFKITQQMVPDFRVVVFFQYEDELLVDSLKFQVQRVCSDETKVTVTPEFDAIEPGSSGKIVIEGSKGTLVGLLGVDEAVYALSKKDLLTKDKIFNTFETHDLGCGPGGGVTIDSALRNAGILIGTNKYSPSEVQSCTEIRRRKRAAAKEMSLILRMDKAELCCQLGMMKDLLGRTCEQRESIVKDVLQGRNASCVKAFLDCCKKHSSNSEEYIIHPTSRGIDDKYGGDPSDDEFLEPEELEEYEKDTLVRNDFSDAWIFEDILIGQDGKEVYNTSLPHSITTWVIQAVSVSPNDGICVAKPQKLVSFQKVFLQLNLPYSVMRNEQVEIQATVFNYGDKRISTTMYMYGVEDLCSGAQPGARSKRKRLRVDGHSAATVYFPVKPLKAKDFLIKVVALAAGSSDSIERVLHVVPEGVRKEIDVKSILLDPSNQQQRRKRDITTQHYSENINPNRNLQLVSVDIMAPDDIVPGTACCTITAIGDQFGPVVETALHNPDDLIQKPHGCGEQNMVLFAPTLYTLRYLKITDKITPENEEKAYSFIRDGYANQLSYRKPDGSFSAFSSRPTSTWLTAFVTKVFCQAHGLIDIEEHVRCGGVKWLIQNQQSDGSFLEKNPLYSKEIAGGVKGKTAMTAFALIALEECKCDVQNLSLAKTKSVDYLTESFQGLNKPLRMAVVAYALALSNSEKAAKANEKLLSMSTYDKDTNRMYWTTDNAARDIETAGYALLTQLLFNDTVRSNSIVNWLNTKRLQSGCFKSTQDTVIALQALSEHAIRAQMPSMNLVTNISFSNDRNWQKVLTIQEHNARQLQKFTIDKIGGKLFFQTTGHGVGVLSVKMHYNVIVPPEEICKFDIDVTVSNVIEESNEISQIFWKGIYLQNNDIKNIADRLGLNVEGANDNNLYSGPSSAFLKRRKRRNDRGSRINRQNDEHDDDKNMKLKISVCVRYLGNKDAGMSIVDVGMFSGFEPVIADLKRLEKHSEGYLIQKYEKTNRGVVFYLAKVPKEEKYCFSFDIIQKFIVGETQMSIVKVYDYYNPDAGCSRFYGPETGSPILEAICEGDICECAERDCPPRKPFNDFSKINDETERRSKILTATCDNYDYVWMGKPTDSPTEEGGYFKILFEIKDVLKEGVEKIKDIKGHIRTLFVRDTCYTMVPKFRNMTYLILGKDGQEDQDRRSNIRYLLDKNSVVQIWPSVREPNAKGSIQRDLYEIFSIRDESNYCCHG